MTLNGKEFRVPGWFIATGTLLIAIVAATWRVSDSFNSIVVEHKRHGEIIERLDQRTCRMEEALRQLGARVAPDVACDRGLQHGAPR